MNKQVIIVSISFLLPSVAISIMCYILFNGSLCDECIDEFVLMVLKRAAERCYESTM